MSSVRHMDHEEYDHHHTMLAERAPHAVCPLCGNTTWERTAVVAVVLEERSLAAEPAGDGAAGAETVERRRPAIALACEQCWFLRFHLTASPYVHTEG
jgi:hypothetical protein